MILPTAVRGFPWINDIGEKIIVTESPITTQHLYENDLLKLFLKGEIFIKGVCRKLIQISYIYMVEKRRSKNIRFLNCIMQETTVMDRVLHSQLLT